MAGPVAGLRRLRALAENGGLDELCERHGISVLTVFGSTENGSDRPRDLDIGDLLEPSRKPDYLPLIGDLQDASDSDIDLVVLNNAGPVIRERALVGSIALYESRPGAWANAATQAALERMDTDWLREAALELLAR
jgi:predicted nucleotidyltransferase